MSYPSKIKKITVLGSGIMGHGIAQISSMSGYEVTLRDIDKSLLDNAMEKIRWSLNKMVEKNKITQSESDLIFKRITPTVDLKDALADSDLLIEAVPEDMNLKKKVYMEVDKHSEDKTVYASNTSTLPITEMSSLTNRPHRFIGVHFFNPPQLMQLVEVIPGRSTRSDITDLAMTFVKSLGKEPVLCNKDVAGFIVNRIFIPLVHEAAHFKEREGNSLTEIDSAVKFKMSFPMGIFELADFTGIDVVYKASIEMQSRDSKVVNPHPMIRSLYEEKKFGKKTGRGFYEYSNEAYQRVSLSEKEAEKCNPIKLLAVAANNAAWLISNNVCTEGDLEKALKLGMGLKENLFGIVDRYGREEVIDTLKDLARNYGSFYSPDPYLLAMTGR